MRSRCGDQVTGKRGNTLRTSGGEMGNDWVWGGFKEKAGVAKLKGNETATGQVLP